jgi:hypothetical protein
VDVQRVDIAIASPGDVAAERGAVLRVFSRWNNAHSHAFLNAVMWEAASVPELGDHPQSLLNERIIEKSDLLVAILWSRLGTPTPNAPSGTVEEIEEFITRKGPGRVMLYFCTRDIPIDTDPVELGRLREFKSKMRLRGLVHEYATVQDFERDLYHHLGVKIEELRDGKFPLPEVPSGGRRRRQEVKTPVDASSREAIDFGNSLEEIARRFTERMDVFDKDPTKYLAQGAHVYGSVAASLDRFAAYSGVSAENRVVVEGLSSRLKRLAANYADYIKKPFPEYWSVGREISTDLLAHVTHLQRHGKK